MKSVEVNLQTLGLVNRLAVINSSVIFEKEGDSIVINSANSGEEIVYEFKAPKADFNFDGDECSFYSFPEFFSLLTSYEKPTIEQDGMDLHIKEGKSKIRYRLTDPEAIEDVYTEVEFEDPDAVFTLTKENIKKINQMIGAISGETINLGVNGDEITVKIINPKHKHTWEDVYELTESTDEEYDMNISTDIFSVLPTGDYEVAIDSEGLIRFTLQTEDDTSVVIYTAEEEEDI